MSQGMWHKPPVDIKIEIPKLNPLMLPYVFTPGYLLWLISLGWIDVRAVSKENIFRANRYPNQSYRLNKAPLMMNADGTVYKEQCTSLHELMMNFPCGLANEGQYLDFKGIVKDTKGVARRQTVYHCNFELRTSLLRASEGWVMSVMFQQYQWITSELKKAQIAESLNTDLPTVVVP